MRSRMNLLRHYYKVEFVLQSNHQSRIPCPHFVELDCYKHGFESEFPCHTIPNKYPIFPIETIFHQLILQWNSKWHQNKYILFPWWQCYRSYTSSRRIPLFVQINLAFLPCLPFWKHFPFPPLKQGLPFLNGLLDKGISSSLQADLHSFTFLIFDPPRHRLRTK